MPSAKSSGSLSNSWADLEMSNASRLKAASTSPFKYVDIGPEAD
jgi:hypothetical protein